MSEIKRPVIANLERLAALKEKGIVTSEELQNLKFQLLSEHEIVSLKEDKSEVSNTLACEINPTQLEPKKSKFKWNNIVTKYVIPFYSYSNGLLFIIIGLSFFFTKNVISGICILLSGLLLLPPIYSLIKKYLNKFNINFKRVFSAAIVIILLFTSISLTKPSTENAVASQQNQTQKTSDKQDQELKQQQAEHSRKDQEAKVQAEKTKKLNEELNAKLNSVYDARFSEVNRAETTVLYLTSPEDNKGIASVSEDVTKLQTTVPEIVGEGESKFIAACTEFFKIPEINSCMYSYDLTYSDSKGQAKKGVPLVLLINRTRWQEFNWDGLKFKPIHSTLKKEKILTIDPGWDKKVMAQDKILDIYIPIP